MGHNIDFVSLLGLPEKVICQKCRNKIPTYFDDYDIDCGSPDAKDNSKCLTLDVYCEVCDESFKARYKFIRVVEEEKDGKI